MKTKTEKAKKLTKHGAKAHKNGDIEKAKELYKAALEQDKYYAPAYYKIGTLYLKLGEYDKAIKHLEKALEHNPRDPITYNNIGCCYLSKNMYDEAIDYFNKAIKINPNYIRPYGNRATAYREIYMDDRARNDEHRVEELTNRATPQPQQDEEIEENETEHQIRSATTTIEEISNLEEDE